MIEKLFTLSLETFAVVFAIWLTEIGTRCLVFFEEPDRGKYLKYIYQLLTVVLKCFFGNVCFSSVKLTLPDKEHVRRLNFAWSVSKRTP